jgi:hypothetical protein
MRRNWGGFLSGFISDLSSPTLAGVKSEGRLAPLCWPIRQGSLTGKIAVRFAKKDGFLTIFGIKLASFALKKHFVLCTQK